MPSLEGFWEVAINNVQLATPNSTFHYFSSFCSDYLQASSGDKSQFFLDNNCGIDFSFDSHLIASFAKPIALAIQTAQPIIIISINCRLQTQKGFLFPIDRSRLCGLIKANKLKVFVVYEAINPSRNFSLISSKISLRHFAILSAFHVGTFNGEWTNFLIENFASAGIFFSLRVADKHLKNVGWKKIINHFLSSSKCWLVEIKRLIHYACKQFCFFPFT